MVQKPPKSQKTKKRANSVFAWFLLILSFVGVGTILYLTSKPSSIRYMATAKPFVLPSPSIEETSEEEPEIKEEELIQLTQPKPVNSQ